MERKVSEKPGVVCEFQIEREELLKRVNEMFLPILRHLNKREAESRERMKHDPIMFKI